ncbi:uncharacterized protein LOC129250253 [Anastrepha obliqua]|uniref:uncharacterized protein LOC129250253 n=1 Tax=Anastrepha obliqua TaxID=95512 RepID=UPI00240A946A|nr:uncharacterized protein LOC129250253 [Anastrepha obliqua]
MDSRRNMEYLSPNQYMRLSDAEKEQYIQNLFDVISDDELFEFSSPEGDESEQVAVADGVVESDVEDPDYTIDNAQVDEADYEESDNESDAADDSEEINLRAAEFVARDDTIWSSQPRLARQTRQQNILRQRTASRGATALQHQAATTTAERTAEPTQATSRVPHTPSYDYTMSWNSSNLTATDS